VPKALSLTPAYIGAVVSMVVVTEEVAPDFLEVRLAGLQSLAVFV
jgi:hypothetical protein